MTPTALLFPAPVTPPIIFGYNGRDGVITDNNGLIYMRARYYSPEMRRFINADIVAGNISDAVTLNRFAYANGNPVSNIDPFGLSSERGNRTSVTNIVLLDPAVQRGKNSSVNSWGMQQNDDGTYSIYDNRRNNPNNFFHEQIFVIDPSAPSFNLQEGKVGLGSVQGDMITGGWEWEYVDLSLLDLGHVEAGLEWDNGKVSFGAMASAWSPSISFKIFGVEIELGAEVGSIGLGAMASSKGFSLNLSLLFGGTIGVSW